MTVKEAYNEYCDYYKNNQWNGEDIRNYLKPNWIDYEEYNFEEFTDKVVSDDKFNARWANGCTRELSRQERSDYYYKNGNKEGIVEGSLDRPTFEENEVAHKWYNERNVPTRAIID